MRGEYLDVEQWPRREHFEFFRQYDWPFFNICSDVCITDLYRTTRRPGGPSLFLASLYASLRAANEIREFRLRLRPDGVWVHPRIHAGSTVLRTDETFGFAYFEFVDAYADFERRGREEIARVAEERGVLNPHDERDDLMHYSVLPWIRFTSFMHARRRSGIESVPRIVFGRHHARGRGRWMPVSVEVHHALVDGLHVGRFLERFEGELREVARIVT